MSSPPAPSPGSAGRDTRPIHPTIGLTLGATGLFLLALGIDLTVAPGRTDEYFSWAIKPPMTAGTIGAFYLTGSVLIWAALAGNAWARARTVILGGAVFSILALIATFIDLDRFNFDSSHTFAVVVSWVWTLSYATIAPLLVLFLIPQSRVPGVDPRMGPPPRWVSASVLAAGAIFVATAVGLSVVPKEMVKIWPWTLTPLTARVLGAWAAGFGTVLLWGARTNDRFRMLPAVATLAVVGLLQLLTVLRFNDDVSWSEPGAWIYVAAMGLALLAGGLALASLRRRPADSPA
jgi:hypothetical protein